jgi:hypothetical protein
VSGLAVVVVAAAAVVAWLGGYAWARRSMRAGGPPGVWAGKPRLNARWRVRGTTYRLYSIIGEAGISQAGRITLEYVAPLGLLPAESAADRYDRVDADMAAGFREAARRGDDPEAAR